MDFVLNFILIILCTFCLFSVDMQVLQIGGRAQGLGKLTQLNYISGITHARVGRLKPNRGPLFSVNEINPC